MLILVVSIILVVLFFGIWALIYYRDEIKYRKTLLSINGIFICMFIACAMVIFVRMNIIKGSNVTTKIYENIIRIDNVNDVISYEINGVVIHEHFDYSLDLSKLNEDSIVKVIIYRATAYEFWVLGYNNYQSIAIIE